MVTHVAAGFGIDPEASNPGTDDPSTLTMHKSRTKKKSIGSLGHKAWGLLPPSVVPRTEEI